MNTDSSSETIFSLARIRKLSGNLLVTLLIAFSLALAGCGGSTTGPTGGNGGSGNGTGGNGTGGNGTGGNGTGGNGTGDNGTGGGTEATFTNVAQIFEQSCGGANCHIGQSRSGVRLNSYDNVMNSIGEQYGEAIVNPGEPGMSPIVDKIESNPTEGSRMPDGGPYLSADQIDQIRQWIADGAENN